MGILRFVSGFIDTFPHLSGFVLGYWGAQSLDAIGKKIIGEIKTRSNSARPNVPQTKPSVN